MKCVESRVHLPARPLRSRSHVKRLEYGSIEDVGSSRMHRVGEPVRASATDSFLF